MRVANEQCGTVGLNSILIHAITSESQAKNKTKHNGVAVCGENLAKVRKMSENQQQYLVEQGGDWKEVVVRDKLPLY